MSCGLAMAAALQVYEMEVRREEGEGALGALSGIGNCLSLTHRVGERCTTLRYRREGSGSELTGHRIGARSSNMLWSLMPQNLQDE